MNHSKGDVIRIPQNTLIYTEDGHTWSIKQPLYGIFVETSEENDETCRVLLDDNFFYVNVNNIYKWRKNG